MEDRDINRTVYSDDATPHAPLVDEETEPLPPPEEQIRTPMSWIAGGATVINFVLGTGPFSYPQIFAGSGIIFSLLLMIFVMFVAFITAQYIVEAISVTCAKEF